MPSPAKLEELMRVDELMHKEPEEISQIWLKFHEEVASASHRVGGIMTAAEFKLLQERAKKR